jgi:hypothetical protein
LNEDFLFKSSLFHADDYNPAALRTVSGQKNKSIKTVKQSLRESGDSVLVGDCFARCHLLAMTENSKSADYVANFFNSGIPYI